MEIKEYINTIGRFSVPIFLFLSGLFFRTNGDFKYLKDKVLKVLIPYSIISIPATIFLIWKYKWSFANLPEIIFSYLFGYKFGYFFIFIIILTYIIGFLVTKISLKKNINKFLIISFVLQLAWLAVDELVYKKFNLYDKYFYQFQINELIFYRMPITWFSFFALGLWYQDEKSKQLVKKLKNYIFVALGPSFLLYNARIYFNFGDYTPYGSIIWSVFSTLMILSLLNINTENWKLKKLIEYISVRSFAIFLIHYFFLYTLVEIERLTSLKFVYAETLIFFPAIFVATLAVISAVKKITGKYSTWIIGA